MNPRPERPQEINISTNSNSPKPLTIEKEIIPKKIMIKCKARKIFDSLGGFDFASFT